MNYPDGGKYEGQFKNDVRNGQGTYYYADGISVYEGSWKDNKKHGEGKITKPGRLQGTSTMTGVWQYDEMQ